MKYQGLTIFILFFGISLLDAFGTGHWARGIFWLATGGLFFLLERRGVGKGGTQAG